MNRTEYGPQDDDVEAVIALGRGPGLEYDHDGPPNVAAHEQAVARLRAGARCVPTGDASAAFLWDGTDTSRVYLIRLLAGAAGYIVEVQGEMLAIGAPEDYQGPTLHPPGTVLVFAPYTREYAFYTSVGKFLQAYALA